MDALIDKSRLLMAGIIMMAILNAALIAALYKLPSKFEFFLTPSLYEQGGELKANQIHKENVYAYAAGLMPLLLTWNKGSSEEREHFINTHQVYFTPNHIAELRKAYHAYKNAGLYERYQSATLYKEIDMKDIKQITRNAWVVKLTLRVTQRLNDHDDHLISDKVIEYNVRVVKSTLSKMHNPFGLMLDGYEANEREIEDKLRGYGNEYGK